LLFYTGAESTGPPWVFEFVGCWLVGWLVGRLLSGHSH
jgi:hypothetical protein